MRKFNRRDFVKAAGMAAIATSCVMGGRSRLHAQERRRMANKDKKFSPGDRAATSGIYRVVHDKLDGETHAHLHHVVVSAGTVFPRCKGCHQWVTFRLVQEAEYIERDGHFES